MNKNIIFVLSLSLGSFLSGCSAPLPPEISGEAEEVNLVKPLPVSPEIKLLTQINNQLIDNTMAIRQINDKPISSQHFVIHYPTNQTNATIEQIKPSLVAAKTACRVELLARTDGAIPTKHDKAVAKNRAINLRNQFIQYGIQPTKVFVNYAAATDYANNNWTTEGQTSNRRVEVRTFKTCGES